MNNKHFGIKIQPEIEQRRRKLSITKMYRRRDILILKDELELCDDGNVLSNKDNILKVGKFLGVESENCNKIPNNGWNMVDMETEGRFVLLSKHILK